MRETLVAPRLREVVVPVTRLFPPVRRLQALLLRDESFEVYVKAREQESQVSAGP